MKSNNNLASIFHRNFFHSSLNVVKYLIAFSIFITPISSCNSPSTLITGSWFNQSGFDATKISKVFIAALTYDLKLKGAVEEAFAQEATLKNISSIKSIDHFKPGTLTSATGKAPEKSVILESIKTTGADAILTVNLKNSQDATRYVPGTTMYQPVQSNNYYNNFYGYYQTAYSEVHTEGYFTTDKIYFIECNLYNAKNEELLWSAQSETTNPSKIESFAKEYAKVIVEQMKSDRINKSK